MTSKTMLLSSAARMGVPRDVDVDWKAGGIDPGKVAAAGLTLEQIAASLAHLVLRGRQNGKTAAMDAHMAELRARGVKVIDCRRSGVLEISNSTGPKGSNKRLTCLAVDGSACQGQELRFRGS